MSAQCLSPPGASYTVLPAAELPDGDAPEAIALIASMQAELTAAAQFSCITQLRCALRYHTPIVVGSDDLL
jgi:hypothetical protein